jgi:hypothetical protein
VYVHPVPDEWFVVRGYYKRKLCDGLCDDCIRVMRVRRRRELRALARTELKCEQCGEQFDADRSDARYCSPACRQKGYRARKGN